MEEIYILLIALFPTIILSKRKDKIGLINLYIVSDILSLILSFKMTLLSTINYYASSATIITTYISLYLLLEKYDKKDVNKIINLGFYLNIVASLIIYITSLYPQSLTDTVGINMTNTFTYNYRYLIAFTISTLVSEKIIINTIKKIKTIYNNTFINLTTSYLLSGIIELIIYTIISYYNLLSLKMIIKILLSTYMIRIIITVINSILITITNKKKVKKWLTSIY